MQMCAIQADTIKSAKRFETQAIDCTSVSLYRPKQLTFTQDKVIQCLTNGILSTGEGSSIFQSQYS